MESVLLVVRQLLVDGKGRVESQGTYTESAAHAAYERVTQQHGWQGGFARRNLISALIGVAAFGTVMALSAVGYMYVA